MSMNWMWGLNHKYYQRIHLLHHVGTIRTIPPSSQSLAIDDLKQRYCCSPRE